MANAPRTFCPAAAAARKLAERDSSSSTGSSSVDHLHLTSLMMLIKMIEHISKFVRCISTAPTRDKAIALTGPSTQLVPLLTRPCEQHTCVSVLQTVEDLHGAQKTVSGVSACWRAICEERDVRFR